jgi:DNA-binding HxlR family transcriptional regulator
MSANSTYEGSVTSARLEAAVSPPAHVPLTTRSSDWLRDTPGDVTREVLDRVGDRWTVQVLGVLSGGRRRHSELAARIEGVSQKMLTQTLRALERDGLVCRTVYPVIPPHVEYRLTELGQSLLPAIHALQAWATRYVNDVLAARDLYESHRLAPRR